MPFARHLFAAALALAAPVAAPASSYLFEVTAATKRVDGALVAFDPVTFTKEYTLLSPDSFSDNDPSGDYYHQFFFTDLASPLVSVEQDAYAAYLSYDNPSSGGPQDNATLIDERSAAPYRFGLLSQGDYTVFTGDDLTATKTFESQLFKSIPGSFNNLSDLTVADFNAFFASGPLGFRSSADFAERNDAGDTLASGGLTFEGTARLLSIDGVPVVGSVPVPATWAMLILGFGAAGAMLRRGSREATATSSGVTSRA